MAAGITAKFTGDSAELVRELARMQNEMGKLRGQMARVRAEARGARRANVEAFGSGATSELKSYVTQMASLGTAITVATAAMAKMRQEREEWKAGLEEQVPGLKRLRQIADTQREYEYLKKMGQKLAIQEGQTLDWGYNFMFAAYSANQMANVEFLAKTQRFTEATLITEAMGKMYGAFGAAEVGSAEQIVSKVTRAAQRSDVLTEEMAKAVVISAQYMRGIGGTDEEMLALISVLSPGTKSKETAARQLGQLAMTLKKGIEVPTGRRVRDPKSGTVVPEMKKIKFEGEGIVAGLQRFAREYPAELEDALEKEKLSMAAASMIMLNLPQIEAMKSLLEQENNTLAALHERQQEPPDLAAMRQWRGTKTAIEVANEATAFAEGNLGDLRKEFVQYYREHGKGWEFLANASAWIEENVSGLWTSPEKRVEGYHQFMMLQSQQGGPTPTTWWEDNKDSVLKFLGSLGLFGVSSAPPADETPRPYTLEGGISGKMLNQLERQSQSLGQLVEIERNKRPTGLRPVAADDGVYESE